MIQRGREQIILGICFFICLFISACERHKSESSDSDLIEKNRGILVSRDITERALIIADSILTTLTLEERVGECLMPSINSSIDPTIVSKLKKWIEDYHIGGVVLLRGDISSAKELCRIGRESKVPLFMAIDAEWGLGMRLKDATVYPKNGNLGRDIGEIYLYDYGQKIAKECKEIGINMVLGPVVDLDSNEGGVIGKRSFGKDPDLVAEYGVAYAKGLEAGGVISVAKHFPGHGSAYSDSHLGVARLNKNISALDTMDLKPFKDYINSGLSGIMAGHIRALSLDPSGVAASVSMDILSSLLREELGFNGLILTDAFDMGGAKGFSASDALRAGADIILCPLDIEKEFREVLNGVYTGELDINLLNERVRRILFFKALQMQD